MKKLARRQNEDSQQTGVKDKKSPGAVAAGKNQNKRASREDDSLRQLTLFQLKHYSAVTIVNK